MALSVQSKGIGAARGTSTMPPERVNGHSAAKDEAQKYRVKDTDPPSTLPGHRKRVEVTFWDVVYVDNEVFHIRCMIWISKNLLFRKVMQRKCVAVNDSMRPSDARVL